MLLGARARAHSGLGARAESTFLSDLHNYMYELE